MISVGGAPELIPDSRDVVHEGEKQRARDQVESFDVPVSADSDGNMVELELNNPETDCTVGRLETTVGRVPEGLSAPGDVGHLSVFANLR
ncbi:hypothetical protein ACFQJ7_17265 [Halovenus rubra]|uniref:Uncharacterized protein n=2 Tax=Halovenus rubra TaxID=869890 RepID=A0ABD5X964_9EURY|nr:hypothetical protein [Halovenus rubra]